jgi:hypothetical protein
LSYYVYKESVGTKVNVIEKEEEEEGAYLRKVDKVKARRNELDTLEKRANSPCIVVDSKFQTLRCIKK